MSEYIDEGVGKDKLNKMAEWISVQKLKKDVWEDILEKPISDEDVRDLVDLYYGHQKLRIHLNNKIGARRREEKEPHEVVLLLFGQFDTIEINIRQALKHYIGNHPMRWFFDQTVGIGPVIASGLCAHIDINKAVTAGAIWRFAGLDPSQEWGKGQKRPWNAALKTLCWKLGDSFVKQSGHPRAFYGRIYRNRKMLEVERSESGALAEQAEKALKTKTFRENKTKKIYQDGKLPPGHLDMRARRYAVKLFLSHFHQRWREQEGLPVAKPWIMEHGGHAHYIEPPQKPPR